MLESINRHFKEPYKIVFNETSLYVSVIMPDICDREKLNTALTNNSLAAIPYNQNTNELSVSFSGISQDKIEPGIAHLAKIIYNFL